jgi:hypothetical protein
MDGTRADETSHSEVGRRLVFYGGIFELKAERRFDELHSSRYRRVERS